MDLVHLVANISWSSNGWTAPSNDRSDFGEVKRGIVPHECYNFDFDHRRNLAPYSGRSAVLGYVQTQHTFRTYLNANDGEGICFFSSRNVREGTTWLVGLYGRCQVVEPRLTLPALSGSGLNEEFVNLSGSLNWSLGFHDDARIELDKPRHLVAQKRIGRRNFANIGDEQARAILSDALAAHRSLPAEVGTVELEEDISLIESLLLDVGGDLPDIPAPHNPEEWRPRSQVFREGRQREIEGRVTERNQALANDAKKRDGHQCCIDRKSVV